MEAVFTFETNSRWLNCVVVFILILVVTFLYRKLCPRQKEFFSQTSPFVLRQDNEIYDSFYLKYYDDLHATDAYCEDDILLITETTSPNENSVFLDIGCGTGALLEAIEDKGFTAFGVDKSKYMEEACKERLKNTEVSCNDVLVDAMLYDSNTFSHITCTHFSIYEIEKKETLLKRCFNWLQCGGYFVVHLVDPQTYKKVLPSLYVNDNNNVTIDKVTKTNLDYNSFKYSGEFKQKDPGFIFTETFTDKFTENVRQNQMKLYMESKQTILDMATKCGFIIHRETTYNKSIKDPHQYLVFLIKPMCGVI